MTGILAEFLLQSRGDLCYGRRPEIGPASQGTEYLLQPAEQLVHIRLGSDIWVPTREEGRTVHDETDAGWLHPSQLSKEGEHPADSKIKT
jgi:hypothetical protein